MVLKVDGTMLDMKRMDGMKKRNGMKKIVEQINKYQLILEDAIPKRIQNIGNENEH